MTRIPVMLITAALGLASLGMIGCGGADESLEIPPAAGPDAPNAPKLLTDPIAEGELLFQAERSPEEFGPVELQGRYDVRFAQYAPEDASVDFGLQTVFEAKLVKVSGHGPEEIPLFQDAAKSGRTRVNAHGRYTLEVSFGDFPFAVRLTRP